MTDVRRLRLAKWFTDRSIPEKEKSYISQLINGKASFGEKAARRLEESYGMGKGYLDNDKTLSNVLSITEKLPDKGLIEVPRMNIKGSMGSGHTKIQYEEIIEQVSISRQWLSENFLITTPANLRLISGRGDSMAPTISDGDIILVDTGISEITLDAVFVLSRGEELFIKRIQRKLDGTFSVISDNKAYDPYPLLPADFDNIKVCGRAIFVWNGRKL